MPTTTPSPVASTGGPVLAVAPTATPPPLVVTADPDGGRSCIVHVPGDDSTGDPDGVDGPVTVDADPVGATLVWIPGLNDTPCAAQLTAVRHASAVRLARDLRAAPEVPPGTYNCPDDDGASVVVYLRYSGAAAAQVVTVQLGGCGWVVGPGRTSLRETEAVLDELRAAAPPRWADRLRRLTS